MKTILQQLLELQALDFGERPRNASRAAKLRAAIPPTMLEHYERRRARGKKGIALIRNRVCTGCYMQVPIATVAMLMRGTAAQTCGHCGLYLSLPEAAENQAVDSLPQPRAPKSRQRPARVLSSADYPQAEAGIVVADTPPFPEIAKRRTARALQRQSSAA